MLGGDGVLIRGASGSGKTMSALSLIACWKGRGRFAGLVADDRVALAECAGRLVARAPAALAGLVEARGLGILPAEQVPAAVLRLVVDLAPTAVRLPDAEDLQAELLGVKLPRLAAVPGAALDALVSLTLRRRRYSEEVQVGACVCAAT